MFATVLLVLALASDGEVVYNISRVEDMQDCRDTIAEAKKNGKFPPNTQYFCLQVPEET